MVTKKADNAVHRLGNDKYSPVSIVGIREHDLSAARPGIDGLINPASPDFVAIFCVINVRTVRATAPNDIRTHDNFPVVNPTKKRVAIIVFGKYRKMPCSISTIVDMTPPCF